MSTTTTPAPLSSMTLRIVESVASTNDEARDMAVAGAGHGEAVMALEQTAGRGQRGNSWESEAGANATFSVVLRPAGVPANLQFVLSQAAALAVTDVLAGYGIEASVKWPNDIYVGDRKICGILIVSSLNGSGIAYTIVGVGVNVNQREFHSDAPNPVSMWQLTGSVHDPAEIARAITARLAGLTADLGATDDRDAIATRYMSRLWRGRGDWPYADAQSGERFMASIEAIAPTGHLHLRDEGGRLRIYAFKEVASIL